MFMSIQSSVKDKILATLSETSKVENAPSEILCKTNVAIDALKRKERVKPRRVRAMAMTIRYGVRGMMLAAQSEAFKQENGMIRTVVMDEAHASRYLVHPGADKTYDNLGDMYWQPRVENDIVTYVSNSWICLRGESCDVKDFWLAVTA
ncbi:putative reverse transcriptase domain-containing protein [Tanacetum coccineum]